MTDIFLETTGAEWRAALDSAGSDIVLSHTQGRSAEVGQRTVWHFATWAGELYWAPRDGIPWLDAVLGVTPIPGVASLLAFEASEVYGVAEILTAEFELEEVTRQLTITIEQRVTDADEISSVLLVIAP